MDEEFACPHCGKNLGVPAEPLHATLMCPYCQQFFTLSEDPSVPPVKSALPGAGRVGARESTVSQPTAPEPVRTSRPAAASEPSIAPEPKEASTPPAVPELSEAPAPSVVSKPTLVPKSPVVQEPPLSAPPSVASDLSAAAESSVESEPSSAGREISPPPAAEPPVSESDTLKSIAVESTTVQSKGRQADFILPGKPDAGAPEPPAAPPIRPETFEGTGAFPYLIPKLPKKSSRQIIGMIVILTGFLGFLLSLFLAGILTDNYVDMVGIAQHVSIVIEVMENLQSNLAERTGKEFIRSFGFQMMVAAFLTLFSLVWLWSGTAIRHRKISGIVIWVLLVALLLILVIAVVIINQMPPPPATTDIA